MLFFSKPSPKNKPKLVLLLFCNMTVLPMTMTWRFCWIGYKYRFRFFWDFLKCWFVWTVGYTTIWIFFHVKGNKFQKLKVFNKRCSLEKIFLKKLFCNEAALHLCLKILKSTWQGFQTTILWIFHEAVSQVFTFSLFFYNQSLKAIQ